MTRGDDVDTGWKYTDRDGDTMEVRRRERSGEVDFITYMHDAAPGEGVSGFVTVPEPDIPGLIAFLTDDVGTPIERTAPEDGAEVKYWVSGTDFDDGPYHTRSLAVIARDRSDDPGSKRIVRGTIRYEDVT